MYSAEGRVFEKVVGTMKWLREDSVSFGISLTGTRHNPEEILSDQFFEFFQRQGGATWVDFPVCAHRSFLHIIGYETLGQGFIAAKSEKYQFTGETYW